MASCHCGAGLLADQLCLPGRFLGKEKGPPNLICVGRGLPLSSWVFDAAPGAFDCGEWVPGAAGLCGDSASELKAGSLGSLTTVLVQR